MPPRRCGFGRIGKTRCERFGKSQGVVPERLNFDGLAVARGGYVVADLRVHPGELRVRDRPREMSPSSPQRMPKRVPAMCQSMMLFIVL